MSASELPAVSIAGVEVHALDLSGATDRIVEAARTGTPLGVHLCNAYVLALASSDAAYAQLLNHGDLNLADGAPVAWYARRAGLDSARRPSGAELVDTVASAGLEGQIGHDLYGGSAEVVAAMADRLRARHPTIRIVGAHAPPFGPVTDAQVDDLLARAATAGADAVWIGLGTPKQDHLVDRVRGRFDGPCIPVGAAFDFIAGSKSRAPRWMRRAGLEWVHRVATEPRRLWKRYLWGNLRFLWALVRTGRVIRRADTGTT